MINICEFDLQMKEEGWFIFNEVVPINLVKNMLEDTEKAYNVCRRVQEANGIPENNEGTTHHLVEHGQSFVDYLVLSEQLKPYFENYFNGKFILNSFGGNINRNGVISYANNIHRDIRSYSGDMPLLLNTLVMLDDFTKENGATYLMSGSHRTHPHTPTEEEFHQVAKQAVAKVGSILIFNSNLWHRAGINTTNLPRRSVTPMYCKPFMKQQYDYTRAIGYEEVNKYSDWLKQVLGFYSRVPASLNEWYQPKENRMYKSDQG